MSELEQSRQKPFIILFWFRPLLTALLQVLIIIINYTHVSNTEWNELHKCGDWHIYTSTAIGL